MKPSSFLALFALLPLGCGGGMPALNAPSAVAPSQRATEVTVVDLGPPPPKAPPPAKATATAPDPEKEGVEFGMIGLLNSGAGGDPNAPTSPWGNDDSDPMSARGNMWGHAIGDSFGAGGLGLTGTGPSAGGMGQGIGLGSIGTLGHGAGTGTGQSFGSGSGRLGGSNRGNPPKVKMGATSVSGRLPPEVIQRIVRQNFGRFRLCYENGLRANPKLEGKVVVKFEIDKLGAVSAVSLAKDTSMPDKGVSACVERSFHGLSFPQPEGGKVVVIYPILFSPADPMPAPAVAAPATPAPAPAPAAPAAPKSP